MRAYIDEFFLSLVLSASSLVSKDYVVVPPDRTSVGPHNLGYVTRVLPFDLSLFGGIKQRIAKGDVVFSLLLLNLCLLSLLKSGNQSIVQCRTF